MWVCGSPQKGQRVTAASFPLERPPNAFTPAPGPRVHSRQSARVQVGDGEREGRRWQRARTREKERESGREGGGGGCGVGALRKGGWVLEKEGEGGGSRESEWKRVSERERERHIHTHAAYGSQSRQSLTVFNWYTEPESHVCTLSCSLRPTIQAKQPGTPRLFLPCRLNHLSTSTRKTHVTGKTSTLTCYLNGQFAHDSI